MMSRSDQKINDFVPVLKHFQGQLFFFISNKYNEQIYSDFDLDINFLEIKVAEV